MKQVGKIVIGLIVATLSPMIILGIIGFSYIWYGALVQGRSWDAGLHQFVAIVMALRPYFAYLTAIPLVLVAGIVLFRRM